MNLNCERCSRTELFHLRQASGSHQCKTYDGTQMLTRTHARLGGQMTCSYRWREIAGSSIVCISKSRYSCTRGNGYRKTAVICASHAASGEERKRRRRRVPSTRPSPRTVLIRLRRIPTTTTRSSGAPNDRRQVTPPPGRPPGRRGQPKRNARSKALGDGKACRKPVLQQEGE